MFVGKMVTYHGITLVNGRKDYPALIINDFGEDDFGAFNLMVFDPNGPRVEWSVPYSIEEIGGPRWELNQAAG